MPEVMTRLELAQSHAALAERVAELETERDRYKAALKTYAALGGELARNTLAAEPARSSHEEARDGDG